MTDEKLNNLKGRIIESAEQDKKIKEDYNRFWLKKFSRFVLVPILYFFFFFILQQTCEPSTVSAWGHITAFVIDIPMVFILLTQMKVKTPRLSDGRKCFTLPGSVLKALCGLCAFSPFIFMLYGIFYDPQLGQCGIPVWKLILLSPVIFIGLLAMSLFMGTSAAYSNKVDKNGNPIMTKSDYRLMRQDQELAGLDPDKMPFVLSASEAKNMSKSDWYKLGLDLELAGYKVFKK